MANTSAVGGRRKSLVDPSALFGIGALPMFLTGTVAIPTTDQLGILTRELGVTLSSSDAWLMATLVTGIAGVALWRAVTHAVLASRPVPSGVRAGLWLGAGLAVGELLTSALPDPAGCPLGRRSLSYW